MLEEERRQQEEQQQEHKTLLALPEAQPAAEGPREGRINDADDKRKGERLVLMLMYPLACPKKFRSGPRTGNRPHLLQDFDNILSWVV